ncbi:uncharacterized protein LOC133925207 [Phragmites australis]|uniref:uncharacterized protein LOC133925207 n=1 Tax=Phragmites australis TaxID=29695 RepID=UPI002D780ECD|nr:uncharacterized protein LOC133925207 [Phragmites australis]
MKKLYQGKGRRVHPAPVDAAVAAAVALPAAVLALASALTAEEQEVLAYMLSGAAAARRRGLHPPEMGCGCFGCYKSFWARWDASPNRYLIHRIIDAVEESGGGGGPPRRPSRRRRRGRRSSDAADEDAADTGEADASVEHLPGCDGEYEGDGDEEEEEEGDSSMDGDEDDESMTGDSDCNNGSCGNAEKSTVGRLVRFIGEKVWGAWN